MKDETQEEMAATGAPDAKEASRSFEDIVHDLRRAAEDCEDERNADERWDGAELAGIYRDIARDIEEASAQVAAPQAAPGAAAAQGTTDAAAPQGATDAASRDAAAHVMTKEEAIVRLCGMAHTVEDPDTLRALLLGCKALARDGIHKRRVKASRIARGIHG